MSFTLPASATSCRPLNGRAITCGPTCKGPWPPWKGPGTLGPRNLFMRLLLPVMASAPNCRPPRHAPISPEYPYALSKYQGEQAVLHWGKVYKLPVNVIRIFNAYGPRSKTTGAYGAVFGVFLAQKLANKPFTVVGDGKQTRDFIYVADLARAFLAAARTPLDK